MGSRDGSVSIVTRLHAERSGIRIPAGEKYESLLQYVQNKSGAQTAAYSMHTGGFFVEVKRQVIEPDHSPRLVQRLRVSGAIPSLRLRAFIACIGTTFNLHDKINWFTCNFM
jgi:hypothetical protein